MVWIADVYAVCERNTGIRLPDRFKSFMPKEHEDVCWTFIVESPRALEMQLALSAAALRSSGSCLFPIMASKDHLDASTALSRLGLSANRAE